MTKITEIKRVSTETFRFCSCAFGSTMNLSSCPFKLFLNPLIENVKKEKNVLYLVTLHLNMRGDFRQLLAVSNRYRYQLGHIAKEDVIRRGDEEEKRFCQFLLKEAINKIEKGEDLEDSFYKVINPLLFYNFVFFKPLRECLKTITADNKRILFLPDDLHF